MTTTQEQIAQLALHRAATRRTRVVIQTDNQRALITLLRSLDPKAVLSLAEAGVRIHGMSWGQRRAARAA